MADHQVHWTPQGQPAWTRTQLEHRLIAAAGQTRTGHVNSTAAGKLVGVSERTVRRWLLGKPHEIVGMKASSREAVYHHLRPSPRKLQQEHLDREYAAEALAEVGLPRRRRRIPEIWQDQQWLDPHLVAVLDRPSIHVRQITVARMDHRPMQRMRNRGQLLDFTEVPTRFHATLLVAEVLELVDVWRVQVPRQAVTQGHAQCWMADAPALDVGRIAVTNGLR